MPSSPHPRSLRGFLDTARRALTAPKAQRPSPLCLVIGNEAADLDSCCSAFLYAYLRSHTPPHFTLHVPLVNIPRPDLALRKDVDAAFAAAGLSQTDLLSLSDLPTTTPQHEEGEEVGSGLDPEDTRWILVDHNELTGPLAARFSHRVVGCVDHHQDEGAVPQDTGPEPRLIRTCGSAATLVVEFCRETWDHVFARWTEPDPDSPTRVSIPAQLARLVLGSILADTQALTARSKVTPADEEIAALAEARLRSDDETYDRAAYYAELCRLKEDLAGFSYRDVLRKDYKEWTAEGGIRLGVSSVPKDFAYLLEHVGPRNQLISQTRDWARERNLDIVGIMTVRPEPDHSLNRELMVWALNERAVAVARAFASSCGADLQLERWGQGELDDDGVAATAAGGGDDARSAQWRMCWRQGNAEHSRKQVAPMLRGAVKQASSPSSSSSPPRL